MKVPIAFWLALFALAAAPPLCAQVSPAFLQNGSYWDDGKAEVDFYDAQVMRDGQPRHCEMLFVLAKTTMSLPKDPPDPSATPLPAMPVIRMSQSVTIPRGLDTEHRVSTLCFLLHGPLLSADDVTTRTDGIVFSHVLVRPGAKEMTIEKSSPRGAVTYPLTDQPPVILRNELPLRVRMLDLSKESGEFQCRLIDLDTPTTGPATGKLSFKVQARTIEVELREEKATNKFTVDRDFPFLLREWKTADGSTYRLKNSLKADYTKYLKEGDREKALKDPMLRHPD